MLDFMLALFWIALFSFVGAVVVACWVRGPPGRLLE